MSNTAGQSYIGPKKGRAYCWAHDLNYSAVDWGWCPYCEFGFPCSHGCISTNTGTAFIDATPRFVLGGYYMEIPSRLSLWQLLALRLCGFPFKKQ